MLFTTPEHVAIDLFVAISLFNGIALVFVSKHSLITPVTSYHILNYYYYNPSFALGMIEPSVYTKGFGDSISPCCTSKQ